MKSTKNLPVSQGNANQGKLLIIEDNNDHWALMQRGLARCLPAVELVRTRQAQETSNRLDEWRFQEWEIPKLILIDLYLPLRQDGLKLVDLIKAMGSPISDIPLVMLSASADSADINMAYQTGVAAYLTKPKLASDWLTYLQSLCQYWWQTVALPPTNYKLF